MRGKKLLVGLMIVGLALAGCGGDDDDTASVENLGSEDTDTTVTSGSGTTGTTGGAGGCQIEDGVEEAGTEEALTLSEFKIEPATAEEAVKAGVITFVAENTGEDEHELVIVKADSAEDLPTNPETGEMDEDKLEPGQLIGEIEPFASGETCEGNFKLEAAKYVLLCNVVETEESGEIEAHFKEGMHVPFEVS